MVVNWRFCHGSRRFPNPFRSKRLKHVIDLLAIGLGRYQSCVHLTLWTFGMICMLLTGFSHFACFMLLKLFLCQRLNCRLVVQFVISLLLVGYVSGKHIIHYQFHSGGKRTCYIVECQKGYEVVPCHTPWTDDTCRLCPPHMYQTETITSRTKLRCFPIECAPEQRKVQYGIESPANPPVCECDTSRGYYQHGRLKHDCRKRNPACPSGEVLHISGNCECSTGRIRDRKGDCMWDWKLAENGTTRHTEMISNTSRRSTMASKTTADHTPGVSIQPVTESSANASTTAATVVDKGRTLTTENSIIISTLKGISRTTEQRRTIPITTASRGGNLPKSTVTHSGPISGGSPTHEILVSVSVSVSVGIIAVIAVTCCVHYIYKKKLCANLFSRFSDSHSQDGSRSYSRIPTSTHQSAIPPDYAAALSNIPLDNESKYIVAKHIGEDWCELGRALYPEMPFYNLKSDHGLDGQVEINYRMLTYWTEKVSNTDLQQLARVCQNIGRHDVAQRIYNYAKKLKSWRFCDN